MTLSIRKTLIKITVTAVMTALSIVLCRFLGFPPSGAYRIEIGFLPISIVAMLFGPVWSGISYAMSDFIGALIFTGVNPFITLCKLLFGVLMGLFFHRKNITVIQTVLFFLFCGIVIDVALMTPIFVFMFGYELKAALTFRLIGFAVNTPVRIVLFLITQKLLKKVISSHFS